MVECIPRGGTRSVRRPRDFRTPPLTGTSVRIASLRGRVSGRAPGNAGRTRGARFGDGPASC